MLRTQKSKLVTEISHILKNNNSLLFFSYNKLTAPSLTSFKLNLKKGKANVKIIKNRLACMAATNALNKDKAQTIKTLFKGNAIGIIYGDIAFCAKEFKSFVKDNSNVVSVVGGLVEGEIFYENSFEYFANLPSKEELKEKLNKLIAAPVLALQKTIAMPAIALKKLHHACNSVEI